MLRKKQQIVGLLTVLLAASLAAAQSGANVKSDFFKTSDGVKLHYLEAGQGPAIVFVPGWTMPASIWEQQVQYFAKSNHVLAMDPRSQGDYDVAPEGHYSERRAKDIRELIDRVGVKSATFVGWSLAVQELLAYVDQFGTDSVDGLVLVDGLVRIEEKEQPRFLGFLRSISMDRKGFTPAFVRSMYKKPKSEQYYNQIVQSSLKTPTSVAVTLLTNAVGKSDWSAAAKKAGSKPILFVCTPNSKGQAEVVKEQAPNAQIEIFDDAGHALFVDDAERFNKLVDGFMHAGTKSAK